MTEPKTPPRRTLVTLLLDRSGSMQRLHADTVGAINAWRDGLRRSGEDIRYTQVHFDADSSGLDLETVHLATPIGDVPAMAMDDFRPRGSTPLLDAACTVIRAVALSLEDPRKARGTQVVVAIQTDGHENASTENGWHDLRALVAEKEALGWQFLFMGAGIDAYDQGARMGLRADKVMSYGEAPVETRAAFAAMADATVEFAALRSLDAAFSAEQKDAAGDRHARRRPGPAARPDLVDPVPSRPAPRPASRAPFRLDFDVPPAPPDLVADLARRLAARL